jgi:hypothetical protein
MSTTIVETISRKIEVVIDLEIAEYDKAGNLRAQYVESGYGRGSTRVDLLVSHPTSQYFHLGWHN